MKRIWSSRIWIICSQMLYWGLLDIDVQVHLGEERGKCRVNNTCILVNKRKDIPTWGKKSHSKTREVKTFNNTLNTAFYFFMSNISLVLPWVTRLSINDLTSQKPPGQQKRFLTSRLDLFSSKWALVLMYRDNSICMSPNRGTTWSCCEHQEHTDLHH